MSEVLNAAKITLTAAAAKQINAIMAAEGAKFLRVSVVGGGCSGFSYKFDLDFPK